MTKSFLFFSLAKHQSNYFKKIIDHGRVSGVIIEPRGLPLPSLLKVLKVSKVLPWAELIEEKCQERRVKQKSDGPLYRALLRLELLLVALQCQALLDRLRPSAIAVWNGSHRYCRILISVAARDITVLRFENGLLPNTTTLDSAGVNFRNSVPRDANFYRKYAEKVNIQSKERVVLVPRKPRIERTNPVVLPERYIFIPFQDDRDTQIRFFSPWISDMRQLFRLAEVISKASGLPVLVKEHPSSRARYPDLHKRAGASVIFANGNDTQALIENSEYVVTINSTVGLEAILLNKPLITLGQAFYNVKGVAEHAVSESDLCRLISEFPHWDVDSLVRDAFLHYLKYEYCVPGAWRDCDTPHLNEVSERMQRLVTEGKTA